MIRPQLSGGTQRRALGRLLELRDRQPQPSLSALALLVAAILMMSVAAVLVISQATPTVYGAQADLLLRPGGDPSGFGAERDLATQQTILQGRAVLGPVAEAAGVPMERLEKMVSVDNPAQTNILRLTVASQHRGTAQRLAELITQEYLRRASAAGDTAADPVAKQLERQADSLSRTLSQTLDRLEALDRERRQGVAASSEEQRLQAAATSALQRLGAVQDQLTALTARPSWSRRTCSSGRCGHDPGRRWRWGSCWGCWSRWASSSCCAGPASARRSTTGTTAGDDGAGTG